MSSYIGKFVLEIPGIKKLTEWATKRYTAAVEKNLRNYGLWYDDLLLETDPEVAKALSMLPPRELELRNKRLMRAVDIDLKKTRLRPDIAAKEDVWNPYLRSRIQVLKEQKYAAKLYENP